MEASYNYLLFRWRTCFVVILVIMETFYIMFHFLKLKIMVVILVKMETFYIGMDEEAVHQEVVILVIMETFYIMYLLNNCISTS